jgi:hypothetical protein
MQSFRLHSQQFLPRVLLAGLAMYLLTLYGPLISQAGISVDDWGDIAHNLDCNSFGDCYKTWFPLFSNRPLAPLPITALTFALGTWYSGYLLINSVLYLLALGIFSKVIFSITNYKNATIFFLFSAIPMIAMPIITSPINQSTATVSLLLWSVSLMALLKFIQTARMTYGVTAFGCLLLAFLTYEVILPLLVITALLPWIWDAKRFSIASLRYWMHFLIPILLVLIVVTLWQKAIAPHFMIVDSRLKFVPAHAIAKLHTFFSVFYKQIPALFLKMPPFLQWSSLPGICFGLASLTFSIRASILPQKSSGQSTESPQKLAEKRQDRFFWSALLCLLASSSIFILSDESAVSAGYQARGLSSTWIAFATLLASINPIKKIGRIGYSSLLGIFFVLCVLCFNIQRNQTIAAWQMQQLIISDANQLIRQHHLTSGATVLGDVPHYLPNNYNDEIVFSQPWDFGAALAIYNPNQILPGPVIDSSRRELRQLKYENSIVTAQNFAGAKLDNFWIYQFDIVNKSGKLLRIYDSDQFNEFLKKIEK